jgi:hypothetical protein
MKLITKIKAAGLAILIASGAGYAADATIGGNIPLNSTVIIYPEQQVDFSASATLQKIASVRLTNNAPGFILKVSFNNDNIAFKDAAGTAYPIFTNLAFSSVTSNWGAGILGGGLNSIDEAVDFVAAAGNCSDAAERSASIEVASDVGGAIPGCLSTSTGTPYVADGQFIFDGDGAGTGTFAAQTTPTVDAVVDLKGSWTAGQDANGSNLMAGTYSMVMTVVMESDY